MWSYKDLIDIFFYAINFTRDFLRKKFFIYSDKVSKEFTSNRATVANASKIDILQKLSYVKWSWWCDKKPAWTSLLKRVYRAYGWMYAPPKFNQIRCQRV